MWVQNALPRALRTTPSDVLVGMISMLWKDKLPGFLRPKRYQRQADLLTMLQRTLGQT